MGAVNNRLLELSEKFAADINHPETSDKISDWLMSMNWDLSNEKCPKELLLYTLKIREIP
jgi:hypothetical protein